MKISRASLRAMFLALVVALTGVPAVLPPTTASQSVSLSDISKRVLPSILSLKTEDVNGHPGIPATGFFIGPDVIATDYRVVKDAIKIEAASPGEDALDLAIVAVDERRTVAILKVVPPVPRTGDQENRALKIQKRTALFSIQSPEPSAGDDVYLFSNYAAPGGGLVSAKVDELRDVAGTTYFHLAGSLGPDSVGSPVLNAQGSVIAMLVANPNEGGTPAFAIPAGQIGGCSIQLAPVRFTGGAPGSVPGNATKRSGSEVTSSDSSSREASSSQVVRKSSGVLQGSALRRVQPPYPPLAKAARISGSVVVEVVVDEEGDVLSARAVSGHPLLKDCATSAARGWKFKPTTLSESPVRVIGTLTFNFTIGDEPPASGRNAGPGPDGGSGAGTDESSAATDVDSRPFPLNAPHAAYTEVARANRIQGSVALRALIGPDGFVKETRIIRGLPYGLDEEAVRAVLQMRFKPATKSDQPVPCWFSIEVEFHLK